MSRISEVNQVDGTLMTLLTARLASWGEIAGTFDLTFGRVERPTVETPRVPPPLQPLRRRDLFHGLHNIIHDVGEAIHTVGETIHNVTHALGGSDTKEGGALSILGGRPLDIGHHIKEVVDTTVAVAGAVGEVIVDTAETVADVLDGDAMLDKHVEFDLDIGTPGKRMKIWMDLEEPYVKREPLSRQARASPPCWSTGANIRQDSAVEP